MLAVNQYDVAIVGGGVIGLSIAWELSRRGQKVCVIERDQPGRAASWAGAGMIPAGPVEEFWRVATPLERLAGLSQRLHREWHERLLDETGIDNGYLASGSIYLPCNSASLADKHRRLLELGVKVEALEWPDAHDVEPALAPADSAFLLPGESQIRNPRHLRALVAACDRNGVRIFAGQAVTACGENDKRMVSVETKNGPISAEQFCITAGSWSGVLAAQLGFELPVFPVRGQIALLHGERGILKRIINVGPRYLVPRSDGRILVGSTMEEVGFDTQTDDEAIADLLEFAAQVAPPLAHLTVEKTWAGLRPATPDRLPLLGRLSEFSNVWIATGHFRAGLQLSTGTAVLMADAISGVEPKLSLEPFAPDRQSLRCEAL